MAKGLGSFSGGATLERTKLDLSQQQSQAKEIKTDDGQGGGIGGKGNVNGGGLVLYNGLAEHVLLLSYLRFWRLGALFGLSAHPAWSLKLMKGHSPLSAMSHSTQYMC